MASPGAALVTVAPSIRFSQMSRGTFISRLAGSLQPPFLRGGYAHLIRPHHQRNKRWRVRADVQTCCRRGGRRGLSRGSRRWRAPRDERAESQTQKTHIRSTNEDADSLVEAASTCYSRRAAG